MSPYAHIFPPIEKVNGIILYVSWNSSDQPLQHIWQIKGHWDEWENEWEKFHSHQQSGLALPNYEKSLPLYKTV